MGRSFLAGASLLLLLNVSAASTSSWAGAGRDLVDYAPGHLYVIAGSADFVAGGFSGNGGPATSALLQDPMGIAFDSRGNLAIADLLNHRVQIVNANTGIINTIAGSATGESGLGGNGGPATSALLWRPAAVAFDAHDNLAIADSYNCRVQLVNTTGFITTIAGSSLGFCGLSGNGGPATSARMRVLQGIAFDTNGNLAIADSPNNRIQLVNASTGKITTLAGSANGGTAASGSSGNGGPATSALLEAPYGIAFDSHGNLAIADCMNNHRVQLVTASTGIITTFAGNATGNTVAVGAGRGFSGNGGPAVNARLDSPLAVAFDSLGNLAIADSGNSRVQYVAASTGIITTIAGAAGMPCILDCGYGGPATSAYLRGAGGVAFDSVGNLAISNLGSNNIVQVQKAAVVDSTPSSTFMASLSSAPSQSAASTVSSASTFTASQTAVPAAPSGTEPASSPSNGGAPTPSPSSSAVLNGSSFSISVDLPGTSAASMVGTYGIEIRFAFACSLGAGLGEVKLGGISDSMGTSIGTGSLYSTNEALSFNSSPATPVCPPPPPAVLAPARRVQGRQHSRGLLLSRISPREGLGRSLAAATDTVSHVTVVYTTTAYTSLAPFIAAHNVETTLANVRWILEQLGFGAASGVNVTGINAATGSAWSVSVTAQPPTGDNTADSIRMRNIGLIAGILGAAAVGALIAVAVVANSRRARKNGTSPVQAVPPAPAASPTAAAGDGGPHGCSNAGKLTEENFEGTNPMHA